MADWIKSIAWNEDGLLPVIVQDYLSKKILMFAWMNEASLRASLSQKKTIFWSRSRKKQWIKGEESGHAQNIKSMYLDCDQDVLLVQVEQEGGIACHTGRESCFFNKVSEDLSSLEIDGVVIKDPKKIYGD